MASAGPSSAPPTCRSRSALQRPSDSCCCASPGLAGSSAPATGSSSNLFGPGRRRFLVRPTGAVAVEVLGDELPIDDVRQHRLRELRPLVAIVDVIRMLPHIE